MNSKLWPLSLAVVSIFGCGPEVGEPSEPSDVPEWLLAGLSNQHAGEPETLNVGHWEFHLDGTVTVTGFSTAGECGNHSETEEYLWHERGDGTVELTDVDGGPWAGGGGGSWDRVVVQLNDACSLFEGNQPVDRVYFKDGIEKNRYEQAYVRGKVCLESVSCPPDPEFCHIAGCRTVWCEGEPPEPVECR